MTSVGDVEMWLEEYLSMLDITEEGNNIIVKARQFLGKETFSKVVTIVKHHGGEYVSAGKESHFRVPKGVQTEVKVAGLLYCPHCGKPVKLEKA